MQDIDGTNLIHTFAGNPLNRCDSLRRDATLLQQLADDPASRYLPLWNLNVLIENNGELGWLAQSEIARLHIDVPPVLLGSQDGIIHFAIDISELNDPTHELNLSAQAKFEDARSAAMALPAGQSGVLAQARSQLDWHRRHRFCSVCGERTEQGKGGHVRKCLSCAAEHFPRTDPVAIMLIVDRSQDEERCLLGQSAGRLARTGMYSALAGFIDQGESIEEAVRREIHEEAGIQVGQVSYHSSQPWPFPSSLMIGAHGLADSTHITIDTTEMTDVRWFARDEVRLAMQRKHATLKLPGSIAIAHHLIKAWVDDDVHWS